MAELVEITTESDGRQVLWLQRGSVHGAFCCALAIALDEVGPR